VPAATDVRHAAMTLPHVDTHSHVGTDFGDLRQQAQALAELATAGSRSYCHAAAVGCRKLYGIDPGLYLTPDAPDELFDAAAKLRATGPAKAYTKALDRAGIVHQLVFTGQLHFTDHRPDNCRLPDVLPRISLLAYIDPLVCGDDFCFCPDGRRDDFCYFDALCEQLGPLATLDDYAGALGQTIDAWRSYGVVGAKNGLAYTSGLSYGDPTTDEARAAFARKRDMTEADVRTVHDYGMRRVLETCLRNGLPLVIHTGFQIWGHAPLEQSNPKHLYPLVADARYRDLTFVLLHGGNPYIGETTYLAGMFENVIVDFTWLPWSNRTRFAQALPEWLEVVPHNRFCWGSDTSALEGLVGADHLTRQGIATVLEDCIERRIIDEPAALAFLENTYLKTPKRVFGLDV